MKGFVIAMHCYIWFLYLFTQPIWLTYDVTYCIEYQVLYISIYVSDNVIYIKANEMVIQLPQ